MIRSEWLEILQKKIDVATVENQGRIDHYDVYRMVDELNEGYCITYGYITKMINKGEEKFND